MLILSSARPLSNSEDKAQSQARHRTTKIVPHRRGKIPRLEIAMRMPPGYLPRSPSFLSVLSHIIYNQERRREGGRVRGDGRLSSRRDEDEDDDATAAAKFPLGKKSLQGILLGKNVKNGRVPRVDRGAG